MDLLALADFNLVATHGGFGRASRASGRPKATLSRRIMQLEQELGVRLIERGANRLRLTEEGAALHDRTDPLLSEITEAGRTLGGPRSQPQGRLRISAPVLFGHVAMGRIAAGFTRRYPGIRLEVVAEDRTADLIEDGYDLVIRINPRADNTLVGRCFLRDRLLIAATEAVPRPASGQKVPGVALLTTPEDIVWRTGEPPNQTTWQPDPVLRLSSLIMVREAVLNGAGAALLPESMIGGDLAAKRLVCWGAAQQRDVAVWVLHTSRRLVSSKVTAFVEYLTEAFPDTQLHIPALA